MSAPKRRITVAERDRALRLRRRLTMSFGVAGSAAVAVLAVASAATHAGTSATSSATTSSMNVHHDDALAVLVLLQHRVVGAFHGVGELRQLILGEYRQRRLMTLAAYRGTALGTSMHVVVTDPETLGAATASVQAVVDAIDQACSRFRDDSELSRLGAVEGPREGIVSPLLAQALATALRAAEVTGGAVDPTVGAAVRSAGYSVDFGAVPADGDALTLAVLPVPGWRRIRFFPPRGVSRSTPVSRSTWARPRKRSPRISPRRRRSRRCRAEASWSAWVGTCRWRANLLRRAGTFRSRRTAAPQSPPMGRRSAIRAGGVATSSTTVRRWRRGGMELHHIIDPATGLPAAGPWRTVSVVAGNCVDANIAATAAIVRGAAAASWLESAGLPARLVDRNGAMTRVGGWPVPGAQTS